MGKSRFRPARHGAFGTTAKVTRPLRGAPCNHIILKGNYRREWMSLFDNRRRRKPGYGKGFYADPRGRAGRADLGWSFS